MPLTPEDVSNKRFTPVRLREGYDMGEVDQFLDEVEAELARLTKENEDLRSKLAAAQGASTTGDAGTSSNSMYAPVPTPMAPPVVDEPVAAPPPPPEPVAAPIAAVPDPAPVATPVAAVAPTPALETIRVETVPQASNAAARLLEIATRNADELVDGAKDDADKILAEARTKSERLGSESKEKADRLEADARTRAQMLDSETAERRKIMFGDLEKERDKLNHEVETLRSFEREYRSRLKSYFTQQLEALNGPGDASVAPTDDSAAPAPKRLRSILGEEEA